jgi:hypothetical protein
MPFINEVPISDEVSEHILTNHPCQPRLIFVAECPCPKPWWVALCLHCSKDMICAPPYTGAPECEHFDQAILDAWTPIAEWRPISEGGLVFQ